MRPSVVKDSLPIPAARKNATASGVTAFAYQALRNNNLDDNTAIGYQALLNNLNGIRNTAVR